jgi:hypothetical protein
MVSKIRLVFEAHACPGLNLGSGWIYQKHGPHDQRQEQAIPIPAIPALSAFLARERSTS